MTPQGNRHTFKKNDLLDKIINMRVKEGYTRVDIFNYLMKDLGYDDKTAYQYMKEAREETDRRAVQNFGDDLKEDIERFEADRSKAINDKDFKLAADLLKEICKLKGHYSQQIKLSGQIDGKIQVIKLNGPSISDEDEDFLNLD